MFRLPRLPRLPRFAPPRSLAVVAAICAAAAPAEALGQRQSAIVRNFDGTGTTVVKPLPDGSTFQVQNSWTDNSVNGIQRFPDDSYAFVNCIPAERTVADVSLLCAVLDDGVSDWPPPSIETTVGNDFLNGDFVNPYDSLFELPGDYVTFVQIDGATTGYSLRLLDVARPAGSFPFFIVQTNPPVLQAFAVRNVDLPEGTTERTNFTFGMQTEDHCIDFDVTPTVPGGPLAGTYGARERNPDGTCGDPLVEDRSATLIPSGGEGVAGTYCEYAVTALSSCLPADRLVVGSRVCVPCAGSCRAFADPVNLLLSDPGYPVCLDVRLEAVAGTSCSRSCSAPNHAMSVVGSE